MMCMEESIIAHWAYPLLLSAQLSPVPQIVTFGAAAPQIISETAFWSPHLGMGEEQGNNVEKLFSHPFPTCH